VTYIFMAVHYPAPGRRGEIYAGMKAMAASLARVPGLLEAGPWLDADDDRVVGISRWESRAAFEAAMPGSGMADGTVHDGERQPRQYFHLTQRTTRVT
jgi:heme-degrading monooxygenase HmoA